LEFSDEIFSAECTLAGKTAATKANPEECESLGQRLARLRKERGITQVELALRLGVAQPVVSDYERGELRLHGELIIRLTQILAVSSDELLGLQPVKSANGLKFARGLRQRLPRGGSLQDLMSLAGTLDPISAREMRSAIEEEFEQLGAGD
jgi:transcriptional regulator with XRE-family HTH domain